MSSYEHIYTFKTELVLSMEKMMIKILMKICLHMQRYVSISSLPISLTLPRLFFLTLLFSSVQHCPCTLYMYMYMYIFIELNKRVRRTIISWGRSDWYEESNLIHNNVYSYIITTTKRLCFSLTAMTTFSYSYSMSSFSIFSKRVLVC